MAKDDVSQSEKADRLDITRSRFHSLLAANPNYFGTFPELTDFPVVAEQIFNTTYEELTCVSYSPRLDRIEATFRINRPFGYRGDLCTRGSYEHVRFYVDYGSGWEDAGLTSVNVHDIPVTDDCHGDARHPLSYTCGVSHEPRRNWCNEPVLPRLRAILSWEWVPPAGQPDWQPPWGDRRECNGQIAPRRFIFSDLVAHLPKDLVAALPKIVFEETPHPDPDPGPLAPLPLTELATLYGRKGDVPAHRFALPALTATTSLPTADTQTLVSEALAAKFAGISLDEMITVIEDTSGDTTYEQLECLGLEY